MSQQPPEDFQLDADDPMLEQVEKATATPADDGSQNSDGSEHAVGADVGMGEANTFEPEEVAEDSAE